MRELASWYRAYAERTGNPVIWDARIRNAEELEAEAARREGLPRLAEFGASARPDASRHPNDV